MASASLGDLYSQFIAGIYGEPCQPEDFIEPSGAMTASDRFAIYRGSVMANLSQALGEIFPVVKSCVGERFFSAMARKYIAGYPSQSASLDDFGEQLPLFIRHFEPLSDFGYLVDVAQLEWSWHRAYHAKDEPALDASAFTNLDATVADKTVFYLCRSLNIITSSFPLLRIWQSNRGLISMQEIDLSEGGDTVVIWRRGLVTDVTSLTPLERETLQAIQQRTPLGTICQQALSKDPDAEINAALATAVNQGWIVGIAPQVT